MRKLILLIVFFLSTTAMAEDKIKELFNYLKVEKDYNCDKDTCKMVDWIGEVEYFFYEKSVKGVGVSILSDDPCQNIIEHLVPYGYKKEAFDLLDKSEEANKTFNAITLHQVYDKTELEIKSYQKVINEKQQVVTECILHFKQ